MHSDIQNWNIFLELNIFSNDANNKDKNKSKFRNIEYSSKSQTYNLKSCYMKPDTNWSIIYAGYIRGWCGYL